MSAALSTVVPAGPHVRSPLAYKGERVMTTAMAAEAFFATEKQLQDNYQNNVDRFEVGKHLFNVEGAALRWIKDRPDFIGSVGRNARSVIFWADAVVLARVGDTPTDLEAATGS